jgi:hypothetical protein
MAFQAKDPSVLSQQLKVQELVIRAADTHLYTVSGSDVVIDIGEDVAAVVCAIHLDNSAAATSGETGPIMVPAASLSVSGENITVASVTLATNDVLIVKYIVA